MGVVMGDVGFVTTAASPDANTVRQWRVDYLEDDRPYAASNTVKGTNRAAGILDWTGQYFAYGATPAVFPGDAMTFVGTGAGNTTGCSGTAICERMQVLWEQEKNDYVQHIVHYGGNGDLTLTGNTGADSSYPNPVASSTLVIKYGTSTGEETTITDIRRAFWDVSRRHGPPPGQIGNRPYSSSSAPGKMRRVKSRLDFTFFIDCYLDTHASPIPTIQTAYRWHFYVSDSTYWDLAWARVIALEDLGSNIEESELLHVRIHGAMHGVTASATGYIKNPSTTTKWP